MMKQEPSTKEAMDRLHVELKDCLRAMKGAEMDIEEGQWEDILPNLRLSWKFVNVCLQRDRKMQKPDWDNMPDEIYG